MDRESMNVDETLSYAPESNDFMQHDLDDKIYERNYRSVQKERKQKIRKKNAPR